MKKQLLILLAVGLIIAGTTTITNYQLNDSARIGQQNLITEDIPHSWSLKRVI